MENTRALWNPKRGTLADYAAFECGRLCSTAHRGCGLTEEATHNLTSTPHNKPGRLCSIRSETMVVALADYAALHHTRYTTTLADYAASGLKNRQTKKGETQKWKCNYAMQHTSFNDISNDIIEQGAENVWQCARLPGLPEI